MDPSPPATPRATHPPLASRSSSSARSAGSAGSVRSARGSPWPSPVAGSSEPSAPDPADGLTTMPIPSPSGAGARAAQRRGGATVAGSFGATGQTSRVTSPTATPAPTCAAARRGPGRRRASHTSPGTARPAASTGCSWAAPVTPAATDAVGPSGRAPAAAKPARRAPRRRKRPVPMRPLIPACPARQPRPIPCGLDCRGARDRQPRGRPVAVRGAPRPHDRHDPGPAGAHGVGLRRSAAPARAPRRPPGRGRDRRPRPRTPGSRVPRSARPPPLPGSDGQAHPGPVSDAGGRLRRRRCAGLGERRHRRRAAPPAQGPPRLRRREGPHLRRPPGQALRRPPPRLGGSHGPVLRRPTPLGSRHRLGREPGPRPRLEDDDEGPEESQDRRPELAVASGSGLTSDATATRDGRWWLIVVPGIGATQARGLAGAEDQARDLVAAVLDVDIEAVSVDVLPDLGDDVLEEVQDVRRRLADAAAAAAAEADDYRVLAARLVADHGLTGADTATVLGVSPQRVSQLLREGERADK